LIAHRSITIVAETGRKDKGNPESCRIISGGDPAAIRQLGSGGTAPESGVPKEFPIELLRLATFCIGSLLLLRFRHVKVAGT
jgi:hypothetical protein